MSETESLKLILNIIWMLKLIPQISFNTILNCFNSRKWSEWHFLLLVCVNFLNFADYSRTREAKISQNNCSCDLAFIRSFRRHKYTRPGFNQKHCQRHNGPEGWVVLTKVTPLGHITSSYTNLQNLDQPPTSKSQPNISISTELKHKNLDQT